MWLDELTISVDWDVKPQTKQNKETFLAGGNFCLLLIKFASILDADQDRQNGVLVMFLKILFFQKVNFEKVSRQQQLPSRRRVRTK